jgi:hypothetical protein
LAIEYQSVGAQIDRFPTMAANFVRLQASAIVPWGLPATRPHKRQLQLFRSSS